MISTLRNLRMSRGLTLRDLERFTGVSNAYLSQLETGKAGNPTLAKVRVLARFFNVDPSDLFAETIDTSNSYPIKDDTIIWEHSVGFSAFGDGLQTETIRSVAAMQLRAGSLFSEMIQGKITGYRVEMDRTGHPATFHVTTLKAAGIGATTGSAVRAEPQEIPETVVIADGMIAMPNPEYYCSCLDDANHQGWYCIKCEKPVR